MEEEGEEGVKEGWGGEAVKEAGEAQVTAKAVGKGGEAKAGEEASGAWCKHCPSWGRTQTVPRAPRPSRTSARRRCTPAR